MVRAVSWSYARRCSGPLILAGILAACANPRQSDAFAGDRSGFPVRSVEAPLALDILLYLPNRLLDVLDLVHAGVALGPAIGVDAQLTRYLRVEAARGATMGFGWFGRAGQPLQAATYTGATFGESDDPADVAKIAWRVPRWDLGIGLHVLAGNVYLGIAPLDEGVDLLVGLVAYDLKGDDF